MHKVLGVFFAAIVFCIGVVQIASATNRGVVYPGQNPDTVQTNQNLRYQRLADGTVLRDLLGILGITGAWSDLNVVGITGLNVQVQPSSSPPGEAGMLYQVLKDDPSPVPYTCPTGFPCSGYQLAADTTQIVVPALINQNSAAIGPLPCQGCSAGQATSYLIEASISTQPGNNRSMMFVSSSGSVSFPNINTEVQDTVQYASIQGGTATWSTASPLPTPPMPSPSAGWVPLAYVQVVQGATNCSTANSCYITMSQGTQFQAGAFGTVTFGGPYAQDGNAYPSKLSTHFNFVACGLSQEGGFAIDNPGSRNNANHVVGADLGGNFSACGTTLTIYAQNGGNSCTPYPNAKWSNTGNTTACAAQISGNDVNAAAFSLYPSQGSGTLTFSCASTLGALCTISGGPQFICQNNGNANNSNTAAISLATSIDGGAQQFIVQPYYSDAQQYNGVQINLYNFSGGTVTSQTGKVHWTCF